MSSHPTILKVDHLSMKFGGLIAINELSFEARRGEITALIGPNGAGKTTVFNCITGFYKPSEGMITMTRKGGEKFLLERMPDFRITQHAKVARTFQNIRLFSGMTVLENLLVAQHNTLMKASGFTVLGLLGLGGYRAASKASIDLSRHWLDKVGLTARADDPAGDLPYGAQRRLEIARAMCTEPELLCLDEPAAGLNPRESAELNALLKSIRKETGTSILLIEHDMSVVMQISDHVVVLEYGQKIADADPSSVKRDPKVIAAYLGVPDEEVGAIVGGDSDGNGHTIHELDGEPDPAHAPTPSASMMAGPIVDTIGHSEGELVKVSPDAARAPRVAAAAEAKRKAAATPPKGKPVPLIAAPAEKPAAKEADAKPPAPKPHASSAKPLPGKAAPAKAAGRPEGQAAGPKTAPGEKPGQSAAKERDLAKSAPAIGATSKASVGKAAPALKAAKAATPKGKPVGPKAAPAEKPGQSATKPIAAPKTLGRSLAGGVKPAAPAIGAATKASAGKAAPALKPAKAATPKGKPLGPMTAPAEKPGKTAAKPAVAPKTAAKALASPAAKPAALAGALAAPRGGKGDDLTRIKGVGPVNNRHLNQHGIFHFDQIAAWKKADIVAAEAYLAFDGRIAREDWVGQAKTLAKALAKGKKA
ncbi:MAG: ATP-binding cassette domain-containing protein [Phyllobacteriaceae bacterium]|nr:ATP-binding cassette domain-containing protein [Phyllobacteriaceae bacterium]